MPRKSSPFCLDRLTLKSIQLLGVLVLLANILFYLVLRIALDLEVTGPESGNDSDYYHSYAVGLTSYAVNAWPIMLRNLNSLGIYDREATSFILYCIYVFLALIIPYKLLDKVYTVSHKKVKKYQYYFSIFILLYPTMFWFTTDIYRDIFMVFLFSVTLYLVKLFFDKKNNLYKLIIALAFLYASFFLYQLRPYLGLSTLLAMLMPFRISGRRLYGLIFLFFIVLLFFRSYGLLDPILIYRGEDGFTQGGATLGIGMLDKYGVQFLIAFLQSLLLQLFGLHLTSARAVFVFFIETIPFIILLFYVIRNRIYMDRFCLYLFYFSAIYATIWVLGNDNLGTAVRLRMFNYIATAVLALRIYSIKLFSHPFRSLVRMDYAP